MQIIDLIDRLVKIEQSLASYQGLLELSQQAQLRTESVLVGLIRSEVGRLIDDLSSTTTLIKQINSDEAKNMVAEAKQLAEQDKKSGVTPEQAFDKFMKISDEVCEQISS